MMPFKAIKAHFSLANGLQKRKGAMRLNS